MEDSRRGGPGKRPDEAPAQEEHAGDSVPPSPEGASAKSKRPVDMRFVGGAMKSLFESADVSIRRDDETRVLSRAQEAIADLEQRRGPIAPEAGVRTPSSAPPSHPPGPRVDVVLWVVLAAGLFGIAGWMLLYGL